MKIPQLPQYSLIPKNLVNWYYIEERAFTELSKYLWSDGFLDTIKKYFNSPSDCILGYYQLPIRGVTGNGTSIKLGNNRAPVSGIEITKEFTEIDCGSLEIKPRFPAQPPSPSINGLNAYDFKPFTQFMIYLPYVGIFQIDTDLIMGKTVSIKYRIVITTGDFIAFVTANDEIIYTYEGNCAYNIPISSADYSRRLGALAGAVQSVASVATGNVPLAVSGVSSMLQSALQPAEYSTASKNSANTGLLNNLKPSLIRISNNTQIPSSLNKTKGRITYLTTQLNAGLGFTKINSIHFTSKTATDEEVNEIESILMGGVTL